VGAQGTAAILARVHGIGSVTGASRWIATAAERGRDGWTISQYDLGDGAYLATYRDDKRYEICVRKARFLAFIGGDVKADVQRFANYLLAAIVQAGQ
jgi:hypothetical protein